MWNTAYCDFYSRDNYAILRDEKALSDLENLLAFWQRVDACDGFSDGILRRFYVLKYAPNSMWTFFVSVWYLANGKPDGVVEDEDALLSFLDLITGFIFVYAVEPRRQCPEVSCLFGDDQCREPSSGYLRELQVRER